MDENDLFFVLRNGSVWGCWLSGKPAVNLGSEEEVQSAMRQYLGVAQDRPQTSTPVPNAIPLSRTGTQKTSVWNEPRYVDPAPSPAAQAPQAKVVKERAAVRHHLTIIGRIFTTRGSRDVTILDLSEAGCQFHDAGFPLTPDSRLTVKIGPVGPVDATVRWQQGNKVGIQFNTPLYPAVLEHIRGHFDLRRG